MNNFSRKQFDADLTGEQAVQEFFYRYAEEVSIFCNLQKSSPEDDRGGIDFVLQSPAIFGDNKEHFGDFKVALDYRKVGKEPSLPTFAFELLGVNGENPREGWLFGDRYKADFYCVQWLWVNDEKKKTPGEQISADDIQKIEYCIVSKKFVREMAAEYNINLNTYRECIKDIHFFENLPFTKPGRYRRVRLGSKESGIRLNLTNNSSVTTLYLKPGGKKGSCPRIHLSKLKGERPINFLIDKEDLIENSLAHGVFDIRLKVQIPPNSKYGSL
ncbi:hypothetical protein [Rothia nasimurium]|uniref:hypothetical protein n=1 Tax=Rothia nasimurium TaxID=85336 RepID=UPI001F3FBE51|nr:hypothetical protein [Rothia nasimurium]